ncbi:MAG: HD domain-containing protein [Cryobacterium sp.]|nr:HD domain-containing protein [Cryobacterium sp.]
MSTRRRESPPEKGDIDEVLRAVGFAAKHHVEEGHIQFRKGTETPYLSHLLIVAGFVWEAGGDTEQVIAAVLHDTLEDTVVEEADLRHQFGDGVTDLVVACSDGVDGGQRDKSTWRERKWAYVDALPHKPARALLVTAADKAHNGSAIVADVRAHGREVWGRFNATPADIAWYYMSVLDAVTPSLKGSPLLERLRSSVRDLTELAAAATSE